jgi:hypothetical protein
MMTHTIKNNQTSRLLLTLSLSLLTTLALIGGAMVIHLQGLAPFSLAHAMVGPTTATCKTTAGKIPAFCEHRDPVAQGCATDAETIEAQDAYYQNTLIGEVDLRYSPGCDTCWVRAMAYATADGMINVIHARITFQNNTTEDIPGTPKFLVAPVIAYTDMTHLPIMPHVGVGIFEIKGQPQAITVPIQA